MSTQLIIVLFLAVPLCGKNRYLVVVFFVGLKRKYFLFFLLLQNRQTCSIRTKFHPFLKDPDMIFSKCIPRRDIQVRSMKLSQMSLVTLGQNPKTKKKKVSLHVSLALKLSNINPSLQCRAWNDKVKPCIRLWHLTQGYVSSSDLSRKTSDFLQFSLLHAQQMRWCETWVRFGWSQEKGADA